MLFTILVLVLLPLVAPTVGGSPTPRGWSQFQGDASHTGYSASVGPVKPIEMWTRSIGGTLDGLIASGGTLIVSIPDNGYAQPSISQASPPSSELMGLSESTGSTMYQYSKPTNYCPGGATVDQTTYPAIWGSSVYYEVDQASNTNCGLGLDPSQWNPALGSDSLNNTPGYFASVYSAAGVATSPLYGWGMISTFQGYVAFAAYDDTHLTLFNAETGSQVWTYNAPGPIITVPTFGDSEILVGYQNLATATLLSLAGNPVYNITLNSPMSGTPSFSNGVFYFGTSAGSVCALNAQGTVLWCNGIGSAGESTPAIAGSSIFFGTDDGNVYALSTQDGSILWKASLGGSIRASAAVSSNGLVYDGSTSGDLVALNETSGNLVWSMNLGGSIASSPILDGGALFAVNSAGNVYAFEDQSSLVAGNQGIAVASSSLLLLSVAIPIGLATVFALAGKVSKRMKGP